MHGSYLARFVIRWTCPALAAALLGLVSAPVTGGVAQNAVPGAREPVRVDAGAVNAAIDKAKAYLYSKQSPDGTWELAPAPKAPDSEDSRGLAAQSESIGQWGGRTALCVYALASAGR